MLCHPTMYPQEVTQNSKFSEVRWCICLNSTFKTGDRPERAAHLGECILARLVDVFRLGHPSSTVILRAPTTRFESISIAHTPKFLSVSLTGAVHHGSSDQHEEQKGL